MAVTLTDTESDDVGTMAGSQLLAVCQNRPGPTQNLGSACTGFEAMLRSTIKVSMIQCCFTGRRAVSVRE